MTIKTQSSVSPEADKDQVFYLLGIEIEPGKDEGVDKAYRSLTFSLDETLQLFAWGLLKGTDLNYLRKKLTYVTIQRFKRDVCESPPDDPDASYEAGLALRGTFTLNDDDFKRIIFDLLEREYIVKSKRPPKISDPNTYFELTSSGQNRVSTTLNSLPVGWLERMPQQFQPQAKPMRGA
jgi:hypothetical protein